MTLDRLLDIVHELGAELARSGDRVLLFDSRRAVGAALRAELRERKAELLEYLAPCACARCRRAEVPVIGLLCDACATERVTNAK
jgi:hypothetical protein